MFDYGGYINQQRLKTAIGMNGRVNPIATKSGIRDDYQRTLEIRELSQFIRRYRWVNLPKGLDPTLMERILYYRGRIIVFKLGEKYYGLPFALNGFIDIYGRYQTVTPLTFNGSVTTDDDGNKSMNDGEFIAKKEIKVCYEVDDIGEDNYDGVILNDYTQGYSEYVMPRYQLNRVYNKDLANIIILIRHNLISSARIFSIRVDNEGMKESAQMEFGNLEQDLLENGKRLFTLTSPLNLQEVFKDKTLETQNYWECYVSLDNLRENTIGIENNGIFKKKERQLKGEQELEASSADLVYQDGLFNRQQFCERFNALFGEDIWCEESEVIGGYDYDNDGNIDDQEGSSGGVEND